jgi:hypothetical protein
MLFQKGDEENGNIEYSPNIVHLVTIPIHGGINLEGDSSRSLHHVVSGEVEIQTSDERDSTFEVLEQGESAYMGGHEAGYERIRGASTIICCAEGSNIFTRKDPPYLLQTNTSHLATFTRLHQGFPGEGDISRIAVTRVKNSTIDATFTTTGDASITLVQGSAYFFTDATELKVGVPYHLGDGKEYQIRVQPHSILVGLQYANPK